jgi:hypothetical protein
MVHTMGCFTILCVVSLPFSDAFQILVKYLPPLALRQSGEFYFIKGFYFYECSMILEDVEDYYLCISHTFVGIVGYHNDINVLQ